MPALRRLVPAVIFCVVALTAAAFVVHISRACPIADVPQPLRTLYKHSDRIAVVRVGATEIVEQVEQIALTKTALHIAEDVKGGDGSKVIHVQRRVWMGDDEEDSSPRTHFTEGKRLLVFLERDQKGDGYLIDDEQYAVKHLSDDALKLYIKRIEELALLTAQEPLDKQALVEWLVRCAEEPATRWEGAYELMISAEAVRARSEKAKESAREESEEENGNAAGDDETGEVASSSDNTARASDATVIAELPNTEQASDQEGETVFYGRARYMMPDEELIALLNDDQKRRLADSLFSAEKIGEGEDSLLRVVAHYGDARLMPFLFAQLRRVEAEAPYEAEEWLEMLARASGNAEFRRLVSEYRGNARYNVGYEEEDEAEAESSGEDAGVEAADEAADESAEYYTGEPAVIEIDQREIEAHRTALKQLVEKRSFMLRDLLNQLELGLASGQLASN